MLAFGREVKCAFIILYSVHVSVFQRFPNDIECKFIFLVNFRVGYSHEAGCLAGSEAGEMDEADDDGEFSWKGADRVQDGVCLRVIHECVEDVLWQDGKGYRSPLAGLTLNCLIFKADEALLVPLSVAVVPAFRAALHFSRWPP